MTVRLGAVTKRGHAEAIFENFGPFWGWFSLMDLVILNWLTMVIEFIGVTASLQIFLPVPFARRSGIPIGCCLTLEHRW
jgi:Mn2+/Fe2+ NRAMP family transporter